MNKFNSLFILLMLVATFSGCQQGAETAVEKGLEKQSGADVDIEEDRMTIKTDEGEVEIEVKEGDKDSWCEAGAEWGMTSTGADAGSAKMVIVGIVSMGKYAGYCHVTYDIESPDENTKIDFYFKEDGSGYQVMDVNGQKFETQWSGNN